MPNNLGFTSERETDYLKLRKKIIDVHGVMAESWFDQLPQILQKYQLLWDFTILEPVQELSYNLVFHAQTNQAKTKVIFKVGPPNPDLSNEITTLEYFAGHGCVEIFKFDHAAGVMLIEQAIPGIMLSAVTLEDRDEASVATCVDIIKMLHAEPAIVTPELRKLPKLADRVQEYKDARTIILAKPEYGFFDLDLLQHAEDLFTNLCKTTKETVVLHGDLHHFNILSATRQPWLAIDPKGLIGDPVFETAAFMCNPYPKVVTLSNLKQLLTRRRELFHELLGYDMQRIKDWSQAHAVLVAAQNLTSHGEDWEAWLQLAKAL